jgi:DHA2 family multidrug resistance protein
MLERGTQTNLTYLTAHLTPYDPAYTDRLGAVIAMFLSQGMSYPDAAAHAAVAIWQTVQRQATMLAYLQVFRIMAVGCLVVMCVVLSLRKVNLNQKAPVGH